MQTQRNGMNQRQDRRAQWRGAFALAAAAALATPIARAADRIKADNADALNLTSSWVGGVVPTTSDVAVWDSSVTAANTVLLGADLSVAGLRIANPGGAVTIHAGNTL